MNNILTSGMVPALYNDEEKEQVIGQVCMASPCLYLVTFQQCLLFIFAARCYASAAYVVMRCPSVRPSVTFVDHVETNKHRPAYL